MDTTKIDFYTELLIENSLKRLDVELNASYDLVIRSNKGKITYKVIEKGLK